MKLSNRNRYWKKRNLVGGKGWQYADMVGNPEFNPTWWHRIYERLFPKHCRRWHSRNDDIAYVAEFKTAIKPFPELASIVLHVRDDSDTPPCPFNPPAPKVEHFEPDGDWMD